MQSQGALNPLDRLIMCHFGEGQTTSPPSNQPAPTSTGKEPQEVALKKILGLNISVCNPTTTNFNDGATSSNSLPPPARLDDVEAKLKSILFTGAKTPPPTSEVAQQSAVLATAATAEPASRRKKKAVTAAQSAELKIPPETKPVKIKAKAEKKPKTPEFFAGSAFLSSPDPTSVPLPDFDENLFFDDEGSPDAPVSPDPQPTARDKSASLLTLLKAKK